MNETTEDHHDFDGTDDDIIKCKVCMKEVPRSEAQKTEAEKNAVHFCGLECYSQWRQQKKHEHKPG